MDSPLCTFYLLPAPDIAGEPQENINKYKKLQCLYKRLNLHQKHVYCQAALLDAAYLSFARKIRFFHFPA